MHREGGRGSLWPDILPEWNEACGFAVGSSTLHRSISQLVRLMRSEFGGTCLAPACISRAMPKFRSVVRSRAVVVHVLGEPMSIGTVKWFNAQKGYGFIQPENGDKDVFVHISAVERSGLGSLHEGQKLSYELQRDQRSGKMSATNLRAV